MAFLTSQARTSSTWFALFALLALLLSAVGIYSVLSGATRRRDVLTMVVRQAVAWTSCGLALGGALVAASARLLESYLFGVRLEQRAPLPGAPRK